LLIKIQFDTLRKKKERERESSLKRKKRCDSFSLGGIHSRRRDKFGAVKCVPLTSL